MLVAGAVLLAFVPILHHAWTFAASRRIFAALIAVIVALGVAAVLLVNSAISDPVYFVPIAGVTVALRLSSPFLLYRRIEDRVEATRWWNVLRWFVAGGFVVLVGILIYHLLLLVAGSEPANVAIFSEKLIMAVGASILIVRAGLRIRPRETSEMWPIWSAAVLFALAFVVVLPYAIPAFEVVYVVSGIIGWSIGVVAVVFDV
ncbi:MAG: hypothetical protein E6K02_01115 [Methanobacteriota archaeon]|nr:MAG: hypothetical protein E6K02_01115 [Euryarchaeota archaeon]